MNVKAAKASHPALFIRRAQQLNLGTVDVRVVDGHIVALAAELVPESGDRIIEANGNLLLPGLQDHHLHLFATAAARASLVCGPPDVVDEQSLGALLKKHCAQGEGWIRGVGFHDSVSPDIDRYWLDKVCPDRPVRIQHRSGMLWIFNSNALSKLRIEPGEILPDGVEKTSEGELSGRFYNLDSWLGERIEREFPSLTRLSVEMASYGITGVTDTGANNGQVIWQALCHASERNELLQRVLVMGNEELHSVIPSRADRCDIGPLKIYLREFDLPDIDTVVQRMRLAHEHDRAVAVHCATRVELHVALAALAEAGVVPGDRIEHASVTDDYAVQRMVELGVIAVTQPHFIAERGDQYLKDVDAEDIPFLYRGASFLQHGVVLAAGSDAPYGATDPWAAMRAAVARSTCSGVTMAAAECLTPLQALMLFSGELKQPGSGLRELAVGQVADLCLLDVPWEQLCVDLDARHVAYTICGGKIIHECVHAQSTNR